MKKTILYRLFGIGKIPEEVRLELEKERIVIADEGIKGWLVTKDFRAPGKYHKYRMEGFSGALAITRKRIIAYAFKKRQINILFDDPKISTLHIFLKKPQQIEITFDASVFHDNWQGIIQLRFNTPEAKRFYTELLGRGVQAGGNNAS